VAKAFAVPPVSTAQILHPERYTRGELPLSIPEPALPPGFVAGRSDVLGELMTRSLLLRCNKVLDAINAAEGWRGDRIVILHQGESLLMAQQWAFETEQDARELAVAIRKACPLAPSTSIAMQKGTRVVAVRGAAESVGTLLAQSWLGVPLTTPQISRPLGEVRPEADQRRAGRTGLRDRRVAPLSRSRRGVAHPCSGYFVRPSGHAAT